MYSRGVRLFELKIVVAESASFLCLKIVLAGSAAFFSFKPYSLRKRLFELKIVIVESASFSDLELHNTMDNSHGAMAQC